MAKLMNDPSDDAPPPRRSGPWILPWLVILGLGVISAGVLGLGQFGLGPWPAIRDRLWPPPPPPGPIEHHNAIIKQCRETTTTITITKRLFGAPNETPRTVTLSTQGEIESVLHSLEITDLEQPLGVAHLCAGNLDVVITTPKVAHKLRYDHGTGIYPIPQPGAKTPRGFLTLSPDRLDALNKLLEGKGFTKSEIGLSSAK